MGQLLLKTPNLGLQFITIRLRSDESIVQFTIFFTQQLEAIQHTLHLLFEKTKVRKSCFYILEPVHVCLTLRAIHPFNPRNLTCSMDCTPSTTFCIA